jgi:SAM-dependent methyltransferase
VADRSEIEQILEAIRKIRPTAPRWRRRRDRPTIKNQELASARTLMWMKIRLLYQVVRENGLRNLLGYVWRKFMLRSKDERPPNTVSMNLLAWSRYDWSKGGEDWTIGEDWKVSLVKHVLEPNIPSGSRVLEIGPGAGRWTEFLLRRAAHLVAVDLTPKCIEVCRQRFKGAPNAEFYVNDGRDLSFIPPGSIDRIWSIDVFVHINARDVENYVRQFADILAPGGRAVIHHARTGHYKPGWRSDMTAEKMQDFCKIYGLEMLHQFTDWDNGRGWIYRDDKGGSPDIISVFAKPQHPYSLGS